MRARIGRPRGSSSRALACRGLVHCDIGDLEDAVDVLGRALELSRQAGDDASTASVLNSLGAVYTDVVQFAPQAAQALDEARRIWVAVGEPDLASTALTNLAKMYVVTSGRLAETNPRGALAAARHALGIARQAVAEADAAGLARTSIDARLVVVGALFVAGDLDAASVALASTRAMLDQFPMSRQELAYRSVRGRWLVRTGRLDQAILELCDGLDLCDELGRPGERIVILGYLVEAHEGRGELGAALSALHEAYDLGRSLDRALASWTAAHPRRFGCALLDIDHFKQVNDRWSHQAGDRVLARLAAVLRDVVRASDLAARYGGEEFAVHLDGVDTASGLEACERIRVAIASTTWEDLIPGGHITISVGLALHHADEGPDALLARADEALYDAKHAGRNRVELAP